jgi:hypothetical protein
VIRSPGRQLSPEQAAAAAMVAEAKARGLELTGPNGLLKLFTKNVLETATRSSTSPDPDKPRPPRPCRFAGSGRLARGGRALGSAQWEE